MGRVGQVAKGQSVGERDRRDVAAGITEQNGEQRRDGPPGDFPEFRRREYAAERRANQSLKF
jgi:hypothetical protein